jgi:hypothetical protein
LTGQPALRARPHTRGWIPNIYAIFPGTGGT